MFSINCLVTKSVTITSIITLLALGSVMAQAAPPCSNASLAGAYYFTVAQIHVTPSGPDYCDQFGTVNADGKGNTKGTSTRSCSLSGKKIDEPGKMAYKVSADCTVVFQDVQPDGSLGQPVHGKILMNGDMVLVDGTPRTDDSKLFHAVGVRTSKAKSPSLPTKR